MLRDNLQKLNYKNIFSFYKIFTKYYLKKQD